MNIQTNQYFGIKKKDVTMLNHHAQIKLLNNSLKIINQIKKLP
jgi:hypothetical protein